MRVRYDANSDLESLLDTEDAAWGGRRADTLPLVGTPVGLQPTGAIRAAWAGKKIGTIGKVKVKAVHNGREIAFCLEWATPTENAARFDNDQFPDGVAVAFPVVPGAPLMTMGAPGMAVNAIYWRADEPDGARQLSAEGLGTTRTWDHRLARGRGHWKSGHWQVVLARPLQIAGGEPAAQFSPGEEIGFGVAIWDGSNDERAGIKSFSGNWKPLQLDATGA